MIGEGGEEMLKEYKTVAEVSGAAHARGGVAGVKYGELTEIELSGEPSGAGRSSKDGERALVQIFEGSAGLMCAPWVRSWAAGWSSRYLPTCSAAFSAAGNPATRGRG